MSEYKNKIESEVEAHEFAISQNIISVFQGLLWSIVLKHEGKELNVGEISDLVVTIIKTTFLDGPEGENYSNFDHKQVDPMIERLSNVLSQYGIKSHKFV